MNYRSNLESFAFRIIETNVLITNANKIVKEPLHITNRDNTFRFFADDLITSAQSNSTSYYLLYCFENELRDFVDSVLVNTYGIQWISNIVMANRTKDIIADRQKNARNSTVNRNSKIIEFFTLPELKDLILSNFSSFELKKDKKVIEKVLATINDIRLIVMHSMALKEQDVQLLVDQISRWYTFTGSD